MDIEELISNLDPNNPAQVKQLQQALQVKGYDVTADGKMGSKTSQAIGKWRSDQSEAANRSLQTRRLENQAAERSWQNQAIEAAKHAAIPAGMGVGYFLGKGMEGRQLRTEAAQRAGVLPNPAQNWSPTRRFMGRMAPFGFYGGLAAGEGYWLRNHLAPTMPTETGQELARLGGSAMTGVGIGITGAGLKAAFQPQVLPSPMGAAPLPSAPSAPGLPPPGAQPPALPPPAPAASPSGPPGPRRPSDRLTAAAKVAGAKGPLTKNAAAEYLAKNLGDANRSAVAAELGVKSGPNFAKRIADRINLLKTSRTPLAIVAATGALAYDMGSSEAEAAGMTPGEARLQGGKDAAIAGGGAAGAMYGLSKLGPLARMIAGEGMGWANMPSVIDAATDYPPDELARARNWAARNLPEWMQVGAVREAADMSQVPQRNPLRSPMGAGGDLPMGPGRRY